MDTIPEEVVIPFLGGGLPDENDSTVHEEVLEVSGITSSRRTGHVEEVPIPGVLSKRNLGARSSKEASQPHGIGTGQSELGNLRDAVVNAGKVSNGVCSRAANRICDRISLKCLRSF